MALVKATLSAAIKAALDYEAGQDVNPQDSRQRIADKLADAIDAFVKSGDGKYQVGTLTAGATAVTAVGGTPTVIKIT